MTKKYWNHNFRFNMENEEATRAWNILHSEEVKQGFKSQNEFAIQAINDFYERHLVVKSDPYLESREREEAFTDRMVKAVEQSEICSMASGENTSVPKSKNWMRAEMSAKGVKLLKRMKYMSVAYFQQKINCSSKTVL